MRPRNVVHIFSTAPPAFRRLRLWRRGSLAGAASGAGTRWWPV